MELRPRKASHEQLTPDDLSLLESLDQAFDQALEQTEISYTARYYSVRQSALFCVAFMLLYLLLGTLFFMRHAGWTLAQALLFAVVAMTTVGYGHLPSPDTPAFQWYTIFFILVGIATLTILVAQVYQCVALEATKAQHEREKAGVLWREKAQQRSSAVAAGTSSTTTVVGGLAHTDHSIPSTAPSWQTQAWSRWRLFRQTPAGRTLAFLSPFLGLILTGAAVIGPLEGWTFTESVYFAVVSLTTVGFGDYTPTKPASIWFAIFWLPCSIGFLSLFLGNVAALYIRLSDQNVSRIERALQHKLELHKRRARRDQEEAKQRALRGQVSSPTQKETNGARSALHRFRGFDTLPTVEGVHSSPKESHRRERILSNRQRIDRTDSSVSDEEGRGSRMATMRDVLQMIRDSHGTKSSGPESAYLSIRSTQTLPKSGLVRQTALRKPSFALRVLVQERFAEILAFDVAGYASPLEIQDNTMSVTIERLRATLDKWQIPRRARKAFRSMAFESLFFVGEHGLVTRGADALYDLTPLEFHNLFSGLLAAMGDADTMEAWLENTQVLADVDLRSEARPKAPSDDDC